jgi:hypothetical protein
LHYTKYQELLFNELELKEQIKEHTKLNTHHSETIGKMHMTVKELLKEKEERDFIMDKLQLREKDQEKQFNIQ